MVKIELFAWKDQKLKTKKRPGMTQIKKRWSAGWSDSRISSKLKKWFFWTNSSQVSSHSFVAMIATPRRRIFSPKHCKNPLHKEWSWKRTIYCKGMMLVGQVVTPYTWSQQFQMKPLKSRFPPLTETTIIGPFQSNEQLKSLFLLFVQVQATE